MLQLSDLGSVDQCSYFRLKNSEGKVHCSLIIGKSRVAPKKLTTVPRLELAAAVISARMSDLLNSELSIEGVRQVFWSDSKIALGYIGNEARKFHVFVANRVQRILESSDPSQWFHVERESNPADQGSRGLNAKSLIESNWLTGPQFLWEDDVVYGDQIIDLPAYDPEVKKVSVLLTKSSEVHVICQRLVKFSNWRRLLIAVSFLRCYVRRKVDPNSPVLSTFERLKDAEVFILKLAQHQYLDEEKIEQFSPFIDKDGLVRVGGRIDKAKFSYGVKHPVILPKKTHVSLLIVRHYHELSYHQGRGITMNEIRSAGYFIIGCSSLVSSVIFTCVTCRKLRGKLQDQRMSDLPAFRLEPSPPFSYVGTDCFGPFLVKDARKTLKRYGNIFTCLASRSVHVEMLDNMSTDAFISSLRNLIAIRGPVRQIRCDQGSNFVGAESEFKRAFKELDMEVISSRLAEMNCEFVFNVPTSSHMGGIWERQIRSIRSVISGILKAHPARLDSSSLRTFLYEAMALVNSRPIAIQNVSDPFIEPITPNLLLTQKSKVILPPPGVFPKEDVYGRKRWRTVQFLANEFWSRWRKEYISNLNSRSKWQKARRNFQVGDVVILSEPSARSDWKLAKVIQTFPSDDGYVRKVKLVFASGSKLDRPVHKLVLLVPVESDE